MESFTVANFVAPNYIEAEIGQIPNKEQIRMSSCRHKLRTVILMNVWGNKEVL
jgi:hypothetical protein